MVYSNRELRDAIMKREVICYPLIEENIKGSSIDVRLGKHFYRTDRLDRPGIFSHRDPDDVERYFKADVARPVEEVCSELGLPVPKGFLPGQLVIALAPHERILAHTLEFVGIQPPGTTEMRARSSTGRIGIAVCKCAGWGDPGYINRWTMEIQNDNDEWVLLIYGERIAQIIFHQTGPVDGHYGQGGKYQDGITLGDTVRNWRPAQMLPKSWKDVIDVPVEPTAADAEIFIIELANGKTTLLKPPVPLALTEK
ncbi:deoxycytidine triphosphate deaminase [Candidatus Saccharibacteria bacterium]|nr:deoxycytidine triphosphate deaminase [Candidatus Saccharibacteria bacterium]